MDSSFQSSTQREGSTTLLKNIKQGNNILELDQGITVEPSFPLVVRQWVIKKAKAHLSNNEITAQLRAENMTLKFAAVERLGLRTETTSQLPWQ